MHTDKPTADKLLFIKGFNRLINDAATYARYVDLKKAEVMSLHQQRSLLPPASPHELHQHPTPRLISERESSLQYAQLSSHHEYNRQQNIEHQLQSSTADQFIGALNVHNNVKNMACEQNLALKSTPHSVEQPHTYPSEQIPITKQHCQTHAPRNSPWSRKLNVLLSHGAQETTFSEHPVELNGVQGPGEMSTTADVEPPSSAKQPVSSPSDAIQTPANPMSHRNATVYASSLYFVLTMIFSLMAALAVSQEARVYLHRLFEKVLKQREWGLE